MIEMKESHKRSAEILLNKILTTSAQTKPTITYGDVGVQTKRHPHTEVPKDIGDLSIICVEELDLPMISAMVVAQNIYKNFNQQMPGDGFYKLWRQYHSNSSLKDLDIFNLEVKEIMNCKKWQLLEGYLNLEKNIFRDDYTPVRRITEEKIGKDYIFKDYEPDLKDISISKELMAERTNRHQKLVRSIAAWLRKKGYSLYEGIMDCAAILPMKQTLLIEVKTLAEDGSDELHLVRKALSQVLYYEEFHLYQIPLMNNDVTKLIVFENKISDHHISFLEKHHCYVLWKTEDDSFAGTKKALSMV